MSIRYFNRKCLSMQKNYFPKRKKKEKRIQKRREEQ